MKPKKDATTAKAKAAVSTGAAQTILPVAAEAAAYPIEIHREFETFEYDLWHGKGYHPSLSGVLRLLDADGLDAGYVYIRDNVRSPYTGGGVGGSPPYVVIDNVPAQLGPLLTLLALPGKKAIRYSKATAEAEPFAAIFMKA